MESDPVFRASAPDEVEIAWRGDGKTGSTSFGVTPQEMDLYNQLAAHQASGDNQTRFLDAFYAAADNSDLGWNVSIGEEAYLLNDDREHELTQGTAHLLDLLFDGRTEWEGKDFLVGEERNGSTWVSSDYEIEGCHDIEPGSTSKLEFDRYIVGADESGSWHPLMVFEGDIGLSRSSPMDNVSQRYFLEDRREALEEGDYHLGFKPDPAAIYSETLGREPGIEDVEVLGPASVMTYFLERGDENPDIILDKNSNGVFSVIDYEQESYKAPFFVGLSSVPSYSDSINITDEMEAGLKGGNNGSTDSINEIYQ